MKLLFRYILFLACFCSFFACNTQKKENGKEFFPADKKATNETVELFSALQTRMVNGVMLGHQDDLAYGNKWYGESGRSDVKSVCGDYPAVFGWNIGNIETGSIYNSDSIPFSKLKQYIKSADKINGISVLTWNSNNKVTVKSAASVLKDPAAQKLFVSYLDKIAGFLDNLKDDNGNFIPVIFQPFNEYNIAGKYWWSSNRCTSAEYKKLWAFTVDYLRSTKKIHHVLYAYSIHADTCNNAFADYYPGNDYVDLVGVSLNLIQDEDPTGKIYVQTLNNNLSIITQFAEKNNKIAALTNTGMEGIKIPDYFSNYLYPIVSQHKLSYVMFGKNAWNDEEHYFIPIPGHPASEDFQSFSKNPRILTSSKI
jgi:hypothetical protein